MECLALEVTVSYSVGEPGDGDRLRQVCKKLGPSTKLLLDHSPGAPSGKTQMKVSHLSLCLSHMFLFRSVSSFGGIHSPESLDTLDGRR